MNLTDGIDLVADLLPRKARHAIGVGIAIVALCYPTSFSRSVTWYVTQRSQELVQQFQHLCPVVTPSAPRNPSSPYMIDRRLDHAGT